MPEELVIVRQLLDQHFGDWHDEKFIRAVETGRSAIHKMLTSSIQALLKEDFERLAGIMYRIDVAEPSFHKAMSSQDPAPELADLVIDRLLEKARTRIAYRQRGH